MVNLELNKKELKGAVMYLRVSTEEQVENYSLDTQENICVKEAERHGMEVVKVFKEEGRSAKTIKGRPVLIELLEFCRKNRRDIDALIVYRLDRLSRQIADYLAIRKKLAEYEITLISASEPTGNSPTERFIETMLAGFAQMDNDVRSERTRNGLRARFLAGIALGQAPLGYLNQNGYAIKDPKTFDQIKAAWELMATGTKALSEMAAILNEQGMRENYRGKKCPIRKQTLSRIFKNKFYTGLVVSRKYGLEVQGQHSPMVTEELYYGVQAVLDGRNTNISAPLARRNRDNEAFPLRRIVICGNCGTSFTGAWSKGKNSKYAYYFCKKRCGQPSVAAGEIDSELKVLLDKINPTVKALDLLIAYIRRTYFQRVADLQKRKNQADIELKKLYELRQSLIGKNLTGIYSDDIFKEQNRLLERKIKDIQITKNEAMIGKYNLEDVTKFIKSKFENLTNTYEDSSLEQKRVLLCSIFPLGLLWGYPDYSNTKISPLYQSIRDLDKPRVTSGAEGGTRTHTTLRSSDFKSDVYTISPPRRVVDCIIRFSNDYKPPRSNILQTIKSVFYLKLHGRQNFVFKKSFKHFF